MKYSHASFQGIIGVARRDITPPVGIFARNWGAAKHDAAEGIHRPLMLTVMTLQADAGDAPVVLVDVDLGWWRSLKTEQAFRHRVLGALGLDASRFLFCLSHTHAAPPLAEPDPAWGGGDLLAVYLRTVEEVTVETVKEALAAAAPARLEWHTGHCNLATNRDLPDPHPRNGARMVCGFNPATKADDTLLLGRVSDLSGRIVATVVNYACHPTTLAWDNRLISPDFVGAMRETIEANTGGAPAMFFQGASGELSPRYQYVGDPAAADENGRQLGFAALATLADMQPAGVELRYGGVVESGTPLAVWKRAPHKASNRLDAVRSTVELPLRDLPPAAELERRRLACTDRALEERFRRKRDVRIALGDGKTFSLPFWVLRFGDAFLVGCMMEPYSWIQQRLRRSFPAHSIAYLNLVNGSMGYLPPAELYSEEVYQVWQTPFERGSLEMLANAYESVIAAMIARPPEPHEQASSRKIPVAMQPLGQTP